jgi:spore maturation protein SpmA
MNAVWLALVLSSVAAAAFGGRMEAVTAASVESAKSAVGLALGLVGVMAFWLGLMRVVQEGGLLLTLARGLRPLMTRLFPDVPPDHPAMSAMIMNIAANMLGLGNAATPFGIKAMVELNRLNPVPGVATNAMVLFLAINTSNVALAPLGVIALRASAESANAAGIWIPTLLATTFSTACGILAAKLLQRVVSPVDAYEEGAGVPTTEIETSTTLPSAQERRTAPARLLGSTVFVFALVVAFAWHLHSGTEAGASAADLLRSAASTWLLPVLIASMLLYGWSKQVNVYEAMIEGAKEGFNVAVRIIPFLVAILVAVGMFRASGLLDLLIQTVAPLTTAVGFPAEALPMAILRPLSGSGAYGILAEILATHGPDSHVGYLVSTLQGSTETTFYVLAVYFGAIGVTRLRHAVAAGVIADIAGIVGASVAVGLFLV